MLIREEGIQSIDAVPEIHDQELARALGWGVSIMRHGYVNHVADIPQ